MVGFGIPKSRNVAHHAPILYDYRGLKDVPIEVPEGQRMYCGEGCTNLAPSVSPGR